MNVLSILPARPRPRLSAPPARRRYLLDAFAFPKACRCCGASHGAEAWAALPFVGVQTFAIPGDPVTEDIAPLELRNCGCGSTLGVEIVP